MSQEKNSYNLLDVLGILYRWQKFLIVLVITTAVGAVIVSSLLDNYYTAYATFVPTNEEQKLFDSAGNLSLYGNDDAVSRALIFAESPQLVNHMINKFNLADRYDIDADSPKGQNQVEKNFKKLYDVKRNKHSGIEMSIQDKEPEMAAEMVREALRKIESIYREATSGNKVLIKKTYENAIDEKENELQRVSDTLTILRRKFNIYDVKAQSEALSEALTSTETNIINDEVKLETFLTMGAPRDSIINVTARLNGAKKKLLLMRGGDLASNEETSANIYAFNRGRDEIIYWETKISNLNEELSYIITQFAKFKTHAYSNIAGIIVLEPVQVPNLKSYPIRSFMVIGSILVAIVLGVIGVIILDAYKRIDWKEVLYEKPISNS
jgi:uncharacterized protein involved in exopolysaccharide biosynthesis